MHILSDVATWKTLVETLPFGLRMIPTKAILEIIEFQLQVGNILGFAPFKFETSFLLIKKKNANNSKSVLEKRKILKRCGNKSFLKTRIWAGVSWFFLLLSILKLYCLLTRKSDENSRLEFLVCVAFHIFELSMSSIIVLVILIHLEFSEELCQAVNNMEGLGKNEEKGMGYCLTN